jgi:hypothetical protein
MKPPARPLPADAKRAVGVNEPILIGDLPQWMRPRTRRIDWGWLVALGFGVLAAWGLIIRPGLPAESGAVLYAYRAHEVAQVVGSGAFYSRWAPHFNYGYGSLLFNYLAPLPHYLAGYHHALTDVPALNSVKLLMILSILAAGTGMYSFVRGRWGMLAGIVAALLYLYSPPLLYTLPYITGELGALMALGLLPWAMWGLDWVQANQYRRAVLLTVLLLSAFLLTESRLVPLSIPVLLWSVISGSVDAPRRLIFPFVVILAAALLTAFYWLPALLERDQVNWIGVSPDPLAGTIAPAEAFAALPGYDPDLVNPAPPRSIGFVIWIMALGGIVAAIWLRRHGQESIDVIGFTLIGVLAFLAATPLAGERPPTPAFLPVLPYHLLLIALACFCILGAQVGAWVERRRGSLEWRLAGIVGVCAFPLLAGVPGLYPPPWAQGRVAPGTLDMLAEELPGHHSATLREGLLLPAGVSDLPPPSPRLSDAIREGTFSRVLRAGFTDETQLDPVDQGLLQSTYTLVSASPVRVELYLLHWPGWSATLNGRPLEVTTSAQGLVRILLPQGEGTVTIFLAGTPIRDLSAALTVAGLLSLIGVARWQRLRRERPEGPPPFSTPRLDLVTLAATLAVWGMITFWIQIDPALVTTLYTRSEVIPIRRLWQGGVDLLGFSVGATSVPPGATASITLYWQAARPVQAAYQSEVWLQDTVGRVVTRVAHRHPGGVPTLRWPLKRFVHDEFALTVPPETPAGEYTLWVRVGICSAPRLAPCEVMPDLEHADEVGNVARGPLLLPISVRVRPP